MQEPMEPREFLLTDSVRAEGLRVIGSVKVEELTVIGSVIVNGSMRTMGLIEIDSMGADGFVAIGSMKVEGLIVIGKLGVEGLIITVTVMVNGSVRTEGLTVIGNVLAIGSGRADDTASKKNQYPAPLLVQMAAIVLAVITTGYCVLRRFLHRSELLSATQILKFPCGAWREHKSLSTGHKSDQISHCCRKISENILKWNNAHQSPGVRAPTPARRRSVRIYLKDTEHK